MTCAIVPGSFDPITRGHVNVIERTCQVFTSVVVAVANNDAKRYLFTLDERLSLAREATAHLGEKVQVEAVEGLLARFCATRPGAVIVKGVRNGADTDAEAAQAAANRMLGGVETLFLPAAPEFAHVSSSLVKAIAVNGGPVDELVPAPVARALIRHYGPPTPFSNPSERSCHE